MAYADMGRPKRERPTKRVNYNLDIDVRKILKSLAQKEGRGSEGSQIEQIILFYEAIKQLRAEGLSIPLSEIESRKEQIWQKILDDSEDDLETPGETNTTTAKADPKELRETK